MGKTDVLDILRTKQMDPLEFHFDNLWIYPMHYYLQQSDIDALYKIATSARLSSQIKKKYKMIDDIMVARGFKRFSAGTNRVIYRYYEDDRFLVKIAVDKVGMQDNPLEYKNQFFLKPFVAKTFYVSQCGTVAFSERVIPMKNVLEFKEIASDVFDILVNKILGLYVVEDVGTKYFMNWGIRPGFGPVLLDYPYVYNLDGDKLFCTAINPNTGGPCNGEIDYDEGFNHLVCNQCGKIYLATDLRDKSADNKVIIKRGGSQMRIVIKKGDKVISEPIPMDDVIQKPTRRVMKNNFTVTINRPKKQVIEKPVYVKYDDKMKEAKPSAEDEARKAEIEAKRKDFFNQYENTNTSAFVNKEEAVVTSVGDEVSADTSTDKVAAEAETKIDEASETVVAEETATKEVQNEVHEIATPVQDESKAVTDDKEYSSEEVESDNSDAMDFKAVTEELLINNSGYRALKGVTGSIDPDTPMFAGDGQTTQFKRKGANKQRRDENGRFVSNKDSKSGGYKKKGYNKNKSDEE